MSDYLKNIGKIWIVLKIMLNNSNHKNDSKNNVIKNSKYIHIYQYRKLHKIS